MHLFLILQTPFLLFHSNDVLRISNQFGNQKYGKQIVEINYHYNTKLASNFGLYLEQKYEPLFILSHQSKWSTKLGNQKILEYKKILVFEATLNDKFSFFLVNLRTFQNTQR